MKSLQFIEVDTPHFDESGSPVGEQTWRFAVPTEYLPRNVDCIPNVASIAYTPATISLGENLGERASVTITFKDGANATVGSASSIGPVSNTDRGDVTSLISRSAQGAVPAQARSVEVVVSMARTSGQIADGYADNLSLILSGI